MKTTNKQLIRIIVFLIGLFLNAFGVAFITKALLGTTPIASVSWCERGDDYRSSGYW